jgi:hypothetical protein
MTKIKVKHRFFPVGQGLFASGSVKLLQRIHNDAPVSYRWVYDCGTSGAKRLVSNAITDLKRSCDGDKIDLLTLSHFHTDHISGVVELLNKIGAKTVMLPWAPLWHRLLIGFDQGLRADDREMLFFVDPVQYFNQEAVDRFEQVLFVLPSGGEGSPFPAEPTEDLGDRDKPSVPGELVSNDELDLADTHWGNRARKLRPGRTLSALGVWEFIPYNDPDTRPSDPTGFAAKVDTFRDQLLNGLLHERNTALDNLRTLYKANFRGKAMNDLSLMLYGGAVGHWSGQSFCNCECLFGRLLGSCGCWKTHETRGAILLTGDGNLKSAAKWDKLEEHLNARRAQGTSVFQVAHHGSRANWYEGLAERVAPTISVFSSDPCGSYYHPHAEVLRDFWPHRPIQVDQHSGFSIDIELER